MPRLDRRRVNPVPANQISARLREIRSLRCLSQAACAELLQSELQALYPDLSFVIDQSDLSRLESGKRPVWDYELLCLARALNVSADYLLGLSDQFSLGDTKSQ